MSVWIDEILEQIDNSHEAEQVASRILSHFNLAGVVFTSRSVRSAVDNHIDEQNGYSDDYDDDTREILVEEYMNAGDWSDISIYLTQTGNEAIDDGVAERMRELGV